MQGKLPSKSLHSSNKESALPPLGCHISWWNAASCNMWLHVVNLISTCGPSEEEELFFCRCYSSALVFFLLTLLWRWEIVYHSLCLNFLTYEIKMLKQMILFDLLSKILWIFTVFPTFHFWVFGLFSPQICFDWLSTWKSHTLVDGV